MSAFLDIPSYEPLPPTPDVLLGQKYSEGNISDPARYFTSKAYLRVTVGQTRGAGVDFTDIQEAIEQVHLYGKGVVLVRDGTYIPSGPLTLYSDIHLIGENFNGVIIDFNNTTNNIRANPAADLNNRVNNVLMENLLIKNSHNTTQGALYLAYCLNAMVSKCSFDGNYSGTNGYDIYARLTTNLKLFDCESLSSATFLYGYSLIFAEIRNCRTSCAYRGIWADTSIGIYNMVLDNSLIIATYSSLYGAIRDSSILNTALYTFESGGSEPTLKLVQSVDNNFIGGKITANDAGMQGVLLDSSGGGTVKRTRFSQVTIHGAVGYDGIKLIGADNTIIQGCDLYGDVAGGHYSLNISNAACDQTRVTGNIYNDAVQNAGVNYNNSGTGTSS